MIKNLAKSVSATNQEISVAVVVASAALPPQTEVVRFFKNQENAQIAIA
jgi:hypothetical protein